MSYNPNFIPGHTIQLPVLGDHLKSSAFKNGTPIHHTRYSLTFNEDRGFAIYTAHNIDGSSLIPTGRIPRRDAFRHDPHIESNLQVDNRRGYSKNPWDRGHLVRRRSLHWRDVDEARKADSETFYWTNITPQHSNLHHTAWSSIEEWVLNLADKNGKQACIFTGPFLYYNDPVHKNHPDEPPIKIPAGFWKIIAIKHNNELRSAGFIVWQRDFDKSHPVEFDPVLEQVRITTIEFITGLSFGELRDADPLRYGEGAGVTRSLSSTLGIRPGKTTIISKPSDIVLK